MLFSAKKNNKPIVSIKPKDLLKQHHQQLSELKKANKPVKSSSSQSIPSGPMLGRGLVPGADVFFDDIPLSKAKVKANRAKVMLHVHIFQTELLIAFQTVLLIDTITGKTAY